MLAEISGMDAVTLQPAAGAHGELTGILLIRAYHQARGDVERQEVIVPDSSHGTNPATASMAGFRTVTVPSAPDGGVDLDALRAALGPRTAAVMLTNPSTLGLFERRIVELLDAVHAAGALAYMDGANMNAILGHFRPGRRRLRRDALQPAQDVLHAPRRRRAGCRSRRGRRSAWRRSCPRRSCVRDPDGATAWSGPGERPDLDRPRPRLPGQRRRAGARLHLHPRARRQRPASRSARTRCWPPTTCGSGSGEAYELPYPGPCKHEFVASARPLHEATGVRTLDVAKRLIDYGFHPPTIYFPLIVEECLLIEPTETESLETLDAFADALLAIAREAHEHARAAPRGADDARPCAGSTRPPRRVTRSCTGDR